jgi:hypothetical protein
MAKTQVGGIRSIGQRDASPAGAGPDLTAPTVLTTYKHQYQSRAAAFTVSLKRRTVHWKPDGSKEEEVPYSKDGSRLDMVRFQDNYFRTNDDEIAAAIEAMPPEIFSLEGQCWRVEERLENQRELRAAEIKASLAQDPELASRVLYPSEETEFAVKPKPAGPEQAR